MKNTKESTLFARYKRLINLLWEDGQRRYTANELNTYVGAYEDSTAWKRVNNNPYYSTRTYQTQLKQLGCITPIKRGLWQINGPIPEWFGSFHIKGLKGGYDLDKKYADHNCIYWNNLPAEHKVNPWKTPSIKDIFNTMDNLIIDFNSSTTITNTTNTTNMNITTDCIMQTITGVALIEEFPQLTMTVQASVYVKKDGDYDVDIMDYQYIIAETEVEGPNREHAVDAIFKAYNKDLIVVRENVLEQLIQNIIAAKKAAAPITTQGAAIDAVDTAKEKTYTASEVKQILNSFFDNLTDIFSDIVESQLSDIESRVELSINYGNTIEVSVNNHDLSCDIIDDMQHNVRHELEAFNIEEFTLQS